MWTSVSDPSAPPRAPSPASLENMEADAAADGPVLMSAAPAHDATLLIAALEEVEARRAAIEWLLDAGLLCLCSA